MCAARSDGGDTISSRGQIIDKPDNSPITTMCKRTDSINRFQGIWESTRTSFQPCVWIDERATSAGEFEPQIGTSLGMFAAEPTQSASCCNVLRCRSVKTPGTSEKTSKIPQISSLLLLLLLLKIGTTATARIPTAWEMSGSTRPSVAMSSQRSDLPESRHCLEIPEVVSTRAPRGGAPSPDLARQIVPCSPRKSIANPLGRVRISANSTTLVTSLWKSESWVERSGRGNGNNSATSPSPGTGRVADATELLGTTRSRAGRR